MRVSYILKINQLPLIRHGGIHLSPLINQTTKQIAMKKYTYKGNPRPFIYISNFGNVYLEDGDIITYDERYVYIDRLFNYEEYHRHTAYLSNFTKVELIGKVDYIEHFESILADVNKTPLEIEINTIDKLSELVPNKDFKLAEYNFSNQFRPINPYKYIDGYYYGSNINKGTKKDVAWYMYHNLMIVLDNSIDYIDAKDFDVIYQKQFYNKSI